MSSFFRNNWVLFLVILYAPKMSPKESAEVTPSMKQRVKVLKFQIEQQLRDAQVENGITPVDSEEGYQYVDIADEPITPIMDNDERKKNGRFMLPQLISRSPANVLPEDLAGKPTERMRTEHQQSSPDLQPMDVFYRRILKEDKIDTPTKWLHCQDLITPYLTGLRKDLKEPKRLQQGDLTVSRFIQLLKLNTSSHTKEELYSVLYQISNIQIRLFQWDVTALSQLIDVLVQGKAHSFKNVKSGIRDLLDKWHLDIRNTSNLLKESRVFRPPCAKTSQYGGSTKASKGLHYSKMTSPK